MELETARLRLRPFTTADGDGLFAILGDRETMAYSFPMIRGESDRFLEQSLLRRDPPVGYALEAEGVPGLAGYVLFCPLEDPGTYELGWFLRRDLWGRGYAGEISRTLLDYAFDVLGLRQVVGETIDLRRAGRLLGQLGMAKLGETQVTDCRGRPAALYQYAVTAEQWRERKRLLAFFDAENRRDWGLYQTFLHPEVVWELRQPDGWGEQIRGIQAYLGRIQAAYEGRDGQFRCERIERDAGQIAAWLVSDRGERSRERFQFQDGLIWREWEDLTDEV